MSRDEDLSDVELILSDPAEVKDYLDGPITSYKEFSSPENRAKRFRKRHGLDKSYKKKYHQLIDETVLLSNDPLVVEVRSKFLEISALENEVVSNREEDQLPDLKSKIADFEAKVEKIYTSYMRKFDDPLYYTEIESSLLQAIDEDNISEEEIHELLSSDVPVILYCRENDKNQCFYSCRAFNDQRRNYYLLDISPEGKVAQRISRISGSSLTHGISFKGYLYPVYSREALPRILEEIKLLIEGRSAESFVL